MFFVYFFYFSCKAVVGEMKFCFFFFELTDCICICIGRDIIITRYKLNCCFLFGGEGGNLQFFFVNILSPIVALIRGIFFYLQLQNHPV